MMSRPGAGQADAIAGVVAHEIAHRVLDHGMSDVRNSAVEREANRLVIEWGFENEFRMAQEQFGEGTHL